MKHLDLNRQFLRFVDAGGYERNASLGWDELLLEGGVVVRGEAASGKTTEFEAQHQRLRNRGHFTFTVSRSRDGPPKGSAPHRSTGVRNWDRSREPGWVFLDALDEAPMGVQSLTQSLSILSKDLGLALLGRPFADLLSLKRVG